MFFKKKVRRNLTEMLLDRSVDYTKRAEAAISIGGSKQAKFFEPLVLALLNDPEPSVRMNAAYALGQLTMKAAEEPLITALKDDGSEWVRGFCATALTKIDTDKTNIENVLIDMLEKEIDSGARRHYVFGLGEIGSQKSISVLTSMLRNDLDPGVRADAAEALGMLGFEEAYDVLVKAEKNDISADVRRQAFIACKNIEEKR